MFGVAGLTLEYILIKGPFERKIRYLVPCIVIYGKIVRISLKIMFGKSLVVKIKNLRPCTAPGNRTHGNGLGL